MRAIVGLRPAVTPFHGVTVLRHGGVDDREVHMVQGVPDGHTWESACRCAPRVVWVDDLRLVSHRDLPPVSDLLGLARRESGT